MFDSLALTYHHAHYNLGRAFEKLTQLERAKEKYLDALAAEPSYQLAREALARLEDRTSHADV